jgi:hypothetical protein
MKKIFAIYFLCFSSILSCYASDERKTNIDPISLKCTSDGKIYTIVTANKNKVKVTQELYDWDFSYQAPITVEKFIQTNESIEIEYTVSRWTEKNNPKTKAVTKAKMTINRFTGSYMYASTVTFINFTQNENNWSGHCQKSERIF